MECSQFVWTLMAIVTTSTVESANILAIFPSASYSHQMPFLAITRSLAQRGHNLTVITPNPSKEPIPNHTDIDISFTYNFWKAKGNETPLINLQETQSSFQILRLFANIAYTVLETQFNSTPVQDFVKYLDKEKPTVDLLLYEKIMHTGYLGILPKIGHPPSIAILTLPLPCVLDSSLGYMCNPAVVPENMLMGFTNKMTFWERLQNHLFIFMMHIYLNTHVMKGQNELARKYFGHTGEPTLQEMDRNKSLLMMTNSWLYQYPRPVFPNTINVGPTHIGDPKPLPEDLATWIEGAEKGVIYFSLGTNLRTHPNVKLFIMQGGLQSLQEAVYFEVPMIGIPFFGDQEYNVKIIKNLGVGSYIDYDSINNENFYNLMKEILYNRSYMDTVKRISALSKTQMMSPRDTAVWWIEYVLKSGGNLRHLQPDHWDMPWYQYFGVDVYFVLLSPVILILYGIFKIICRCRRMPRVEKLKKS
ncbi:hypothetical protein M8J75_010261 [Diaphorina citri]|nr:hypothetical protein M8J75_010261 [Diaphorina citri]